MDEWLVNEWWGLVETVETIPLYFMGDFMKS